MKNIKEKISALESEGIDTNLLQLMLDPKRDDIGNTVENYLTRLQRSGLGKHAKYLTIMANGGKSMMKKAVAKRNQLGLKTKLLAVTALTTLDDEETLRIYGENREHSVLKMAQDAFDAGMDGIVCSSEEATLLRGVFTNTNFVIVTPGIRSEEGTVANDDQKNINTPVGARRNGVDEEVIGRDILANKKIPDVVEALRNVLSATEGIQKDDVELKTYEYERILYTGSMDQLLKYIGTIISTDPVNGPLMRTKMGALTNRFANNSITERDPRVLKRITFELFSSLRKLGIKKVDEVVGIAQGSIVVGSHMASALGSKYRYAEKLTKEIPLSEKQMEEKIALERILKEKGIDYLTLKTQSTQEMGFERHDHDLEGKTFVISEDVITTGSSAKEVKELIESQGGKVDAIVCTLNRSKPYVDNIDGVPIIACFVPDPAEIYNYYDNKTPLGEIDNQGLIKLENPNVPLIERGKVKERRSELVELTNSK